MPRAINAPGVMISFLFEKHRLFNLCKFVNLLNNFVGCLDLCQIEEYFFVVFGIIVDVSE